MAGGKYGDSIRVSGRPVGRVLRRRTRIRRAIGLFVILSEFSVGSGIRRIESCVSRSAEEFVDKQHDLLSSLSGALATTPDELGERIERMQREMKDLQNANTQLLAQSAAADAKSFADDVVSENGRNFIGRVIEGMDVKTLLLTANAVRDTFSDGVIALAGVNDGAVTLVVSASANLVADGVHAGNLVKLAAPLVGGKGGGQAAQAQGGGKDPAGASKALQAIRDAVFS